MDSLKIFPPKLLEKVLQHFNVSIDDILQMKKNFHYYKNNATITELALKKAKKEHKIATDEYINNTRKYREIRKMIDDLRFDEGIEKLKNIIQPKINGK